ncbi:MAG TPA: transposase, partial [Candidatus Faecisoma merdavium]|nr:transposase [Candidatus Faecisoma merdavium]
KELEELSEKSDIVDNFKEDVIKANEDEFVVDWISREEEQKQYEEVMYEKGLNQGKQQGLLEGIEQGFKKGVKKTNINNARKMLELNMDLDMISKITGLTKEEIKGLRN